MTLPAIVGGILDFIKAFIKSIKEMRGCDADSGAYFFNLVHLAAVILLIVAILFSLARRLFV